MSKSGSFAHFGSKEELQLATVDHAADIFVREVITPGHSAPRGVARIWALLDAHIDYIEREVFAGGCFFSTTSMEFSDRPGPVRIVSSSRWLAGTATSSTRSSRRRSSARSMPTSTRAGSPSS